MTPSKEIVDERTKVEGGAHSQRSEMMRHFPVKKLVAVLLIALVAAAAVWVIVRIQLAKQMALVPDLLPASTLAFVEAPDLRQARKEWRASDLYQIWKEPAVRAWLDQPLGRLMKDRPGHEALEEFLRVGPTHSFLALTSLKNNEPTLIGGFHFEQTPEEVRQFIEQRETDLLSKAPDAKRETIIYEQHKIETVQISHFIFARVYDNQWFFASNDLNTLKALLNRLDHRRENAHDSLREDPAFAATAKHLPQDFAILLFLDPRPFVEKLSPLIAMTGHSLALDQLQRFRQMRTMTAAIGFDHGKMRETDFVAMPSMGAAGPRLRRPLLGAAGTNTFLYSVSLIHWTNNLQAPAAPAALGLPTLVRQITAVMNARGISQEDWRQAFGDELEIAAAWPTDSHWPSLVAALPVKEVEKARKIAEALTSVEIAGAPWNQATHDDAIFFNSQPFGDFIPIRPALALTKNFMLAGSDLATVEATLNRLAQPPDELQKSALFHEAFIKVSRGENAFSYVDARLLYQRLDAAARPLLAMGASFYPALTQTVNSTGLPPPEAIAKHLSPIVMSQRYEDGGYVTESVGPVTFREATIGLVGALGGIFVSLQTVLKNHPLLQMPDASPTPALVQPLPTPTSSPF
ncbi:MAG: hypothetical protein ACR2G0_11670 [Chthoniobacterales bacterium]